MEKGQELSLRPNNRIQKILLSTPAYFVGEFESPDLLISQAWPPLTAGRPKWFGVHGDSLSRTAIVLAFRTPPPPEPAPGVIVPNYEHAGEVVASTLSVLFGKRFDSHGPFEMAGSFGVPDLSAFATPCDPRLRHNDARSRVDYSLPLNLSEIERIAGPILGQSENPGVAVFLSAAKFYRRALLTIEVDPESAYLNLITAGEIISNSYKLTDDEALDESARDVLRRIANEIPDGARLAKFLRGRLRGVKRRFVAAIVAMIDDSFFDRWEAEERTGSFQRSDFRRRIAAAYDLRSNFVHSGFPFGRWISLSLAKFEVPFGKPVISNKDVAEILYWAPLFGGLERVIR
jgi:hypothetical protein